MNPAAPVTRSCIARTLLALRARFSDLAPAALDLLRPIEVLKRLAALALLGQSAAEVVLGIGLIELAGSLQLRNGLPRDGLGLGPPPLAEQRSGLVGELLAAPARR